ncbi:MAG: hypothetical protein AB1847_21505 [bacterium]
MKHKILESYLAVWLRDYYSDVTVCLIVRPSTVIGNLIILSPTIEIALNPLELLIHPMEAPLMLSLDGGISSFPVANMLMGERKQIGIAITRSDGIPIEFDNALYRIYCIDGTPQCDEATPAINGHNVFTEVPAAMRGYFYIEFTITVNGVIVKARRTYQVK